MGGTQSGAKNGYQLTINQINTARQEALRRIANDEPAAEPETPNTPDKPEVPDTPDNPVIPSCDKPIDPLANNYPQWKSTQTYPNAKTLVRYNNLVWSNKWYANSGQKPGKAAVWELTSDVVMPWSSSQSYSGKSEVTYNGYIWQAKWWIGAGNKPGQSTTWQKKALCAALAEDSSAID